MIYLAAGKVYQGVVVQIIPASNLNTKRELVVQDISFYQVLLT